jgi:hypothetical protein
MKSVYFKIYPKGKLLKNTPPAQIRNCPTVSKIMKFVIFEINYKGHLLKTHPQPSYETAPGLENLEICKLRENQ